MSVVDQGFFFFGFFLQVHFIVAACENMISGGGMRPGDVVTASNGKTIEVENRFPYISIYIYCVLLQLCSLLSLFTGQQH